ncbi:MAG: hypothetical protein H0X41_07925 [Chitinophagaceae bacterium]|nr:hypothetical protein [Chitinophagaceae bacterium]
MKRFIYTMVPLLFCMNLAAQKDFYIFIQQSSGQPFYVRMGEKSFSSSAGGHLILAGLQDSICSLYIGFPKNVAPEQLFHVPMHQKDRGFELKNINGEWTLSDLQSPELITAAATKEKNQGVSGAKKTDSYSLLMAGVVDDSTVLYSNVVVKNEQKQQPDTLVSTPPVKTKKKQRAIKKDGIALKKDTAATTDTGAAVINAKDSVASEPVAAATMGAGKDIVRYGSENTVEGKEIIYIDKTSPVADTIRIVIPRL